MLANEVLEKPIRMAANAMAESMGHPRPVNSTGNGTRRH
jgi:hypothetical protein